MIEESSTLVSLTGVSIPIEAGLSRERVEIPDGTYSRQDLVDKLADYWIPLMECHKCGRFSYCKFVQRRPGQPHKAQQIQCGVVLKALSNFLLVAWDRLPGYNQEQLQRFFNGLFYFVDFVYTSEITIGSYIDPEYLDWAGNDLASRTFGYIAHLRTALDSFSAEFAELPGFYAQGIWVLVEGEAEEAFINRLVERKMFGSHVAKAESYGGKGNAKLRTLYVRSLQKRGYLVLLQGDKDGSKSSKLDEFVRQGIVEEWMVFRFATDFEGTFPPRVLRRALAMVGHAVDQSWLEGMMTGANREPVMKTVEAKIKADISKVGLGRALADVVASSWSQVVQDKENDISRLVLTLRLGKPLDVLEGEE